MKNLEQMIKMYRNVLIVGWGITCAKLYSEMRYYQGRIDARTETISELKDLIITLGKDMDEEVEVE